MNAAPGRAPFLPARAWLAAAAVLAALVPLLWAGCTVTKQNYKMLSFFFDGVPDPDAIAAGAIGADPRLSPTYVQHKPYAEEKCSECHTGNFKLSRRNSSMCLKCHENAPKQYERMHGPVAAMACMWCHDPHESANASLLRGPDRTVCAQCHTPELLGSEKVPEHADANRACLDCHHAHGGKEAYFLRETPRGGPAAPAPVPK